MSGQIAVGGRNLHQHESALERGRGNEALPIDGRLAERLADHVT